MSSSGTRGKQKPAPSPPSPLSSDDDSGTSGKPRSTLPPPSPLSSGDDTPESSGSETVKSGNKSLPSGEKAYPPSGPSPNLPRRPRFQENFEKSKSDWSREDFLPSGAGKGNGGNASRGGGTARNRQASESESTASSALTPSSDEFDTDNRPLKDGATKGSRTTSTAQNTPKVSSESESEDEGERPPPTSTPSKKSSRQTPVTPDSEPSEDEQSQPSAKVRRRDSTMSSSSTVVPNQRAARPARPSGQQSATPIPQSRPARPTPSTSRPSERTSRKRPLDPDEMDPPEQCCCCDLNCAACSSCASCLKGLPDWKIWSFIRRNSAYACAAGLCLGMLAVGLTGIVDGWTFCSVGGYDLGAIGYCQDGECTMRFVYNVPIGFDGIAQSTYILSGLLLGFTLLGTASTSYFILVIFSQWCCQGQLHCSCPSPRSLIRCIFCCCVQASSDPSHTSDIEAQKKQFQDRKLERRAMKDNRMKPEEWERTPRGEKERLKTVSKNKNVFEIIVFLVLLVGSAVSVGCYAWMEVVNAQETLASDLAIYGFAITAVAFLVTSQIYRTTVPGATRAKLMQKKYVAQQYAKRLAAQAEARARHAGQKTKQVGSSAVSKAGEAGNNVRARARRSSRG